MRTKYEIEEMITAFKEIIAELKIDRQNQTNMEKTPKINVKIGHLSDKIDLLKWVLEGGD